MRISGGIALVSAVVLVATGSAILVSAWRQARVAACRNQLAQIAGAKGSHGLEHRLARGAPVRSEDVSPFLKNGWEGLRCPSGGQYTPGRFTGDKDTGEERFAPSCSVHGSLATLETSPRRHTLAPQELHAVAAGCFLLAAGVGFLYVRDRNRQIGESRS